MQKLFFLKSLKSIEDLKLLFLIFTIIAGILILYPYLDFQDYISQGDHGRDLYAFQKTFEGAVPYVDFRYDNGPFMLYYYSFFYRLFGVSIQSTLLGYNLFVFLTGIFLFLSCSVFLNPLMSFICAIWYWAFRGPEFFYTYNHVGPIFFMILTLYYLFLYIKNPKKTFIYGGMISSFLLILARPNIGLGALVSFFLMVSLMRRSKDQSAQSRRGISSGIIFLGILGLSALVYGIIILRAPAEVASYDLAYWKRINPKAMRYILLLFKEHVVYNITLSNMRKVFFLFLSIASVKTIINLTQNKFAPQEERKKISLALFSLVLFISFCSIEFFLSAIWFRIMWILSPFLLFIFFLLDIGFRDLQKSLKILVSFMLLTLSFLAIWDAHDYVASCKKPSCQLYVGSNHVYTSCEQKHWISVVSQTVDFIRKNVPENEKIAGIPYDPIYYFLSDRDAGVRVSIIGKNKLKEKGEIKQLEENRVNYIIYSNRRERRFGTLGKTFGLKIKSYMDENFETIQSFGDWDAPAAWITNHATRILKRKIPF